MLAVITNFLWEVLVSFRHWHILLFFRQNLLGTENELDYFCKLRGLLICKSLYIFWVISHLRFCEVLEFSSVKNERIKSAFVPEWKSLSLFSKWLIKLVWAINSHNKYSSLKQKGENTRCRRKQGFSSFCDC